MERASLCSTIRLEQDFTEVNKIETIELKKYNKNSARVLYRSKFGGYSALDDIISTDLIINGCTTNKSPVICFKLLTELSTFAEIAGLFPESALPRIHSVSPHFLSSPQVL